MGIHCDSPLQVSWHNDYVVRAAAEALAVADLDSTEACHGGRHWSEDSYGDPCVGGSRLKRSPADMERVAPEWWECAVGEKNRLRRIYSREPGWHGPNDCVGCTGGTLAPRARRADDAAEEQGGFAALEALCREAGMAVAAVAAESVVEQCLDQTMEEELRIAAVVAVAAVAVAAEAVGVVVDVVAAVVAAAAAVAVGGGDAAVVEDVAELEQRAAAAVVEEEGEGGGVAIEGSRVADGDHQARVVRRRDEI